MINFQHRGYTFRLEKYHYSPGNSGRLSGPPEYCYPPEPSELEIEELSIVSTCYHKVKSIQPVSTIMIDYLCDDDSFLDAAVDAVERSEMILTKDEYNEDDWRDER